MAAPNAIAPHHHGQRRSASDPTSRQSAPLTPAPTAPARRTRQSARPPEPDCSPFAIFRPSRVCFGTTPADYPQGACVVGWVERCETHAAAAPAWVSFLDPPYLTTVTSG